MLSKRSVFSTAINLPPAAAADVDTLGHWTTQPRPCEPACSRSPPRLCFAEHAEPADAPTARILRCPYLTRSSTARARGSACDGDVRLLPRLLMPNSFCLPPVEYCRGTTPTQAAKSRPRRKAAPLPMAATVAVETSGPKPGIWRSRRQRASSLLMCSISSVIALMCILRLLPLLPQPIQQPAQARAQVLLGIFNHCG